MNDNKQVRRMSILAEVASMYYEQDLTQSQIAARLCLSRTRISKLLKMAKAEGIVEIRIRYAAERSYELEEILKRRFGLKEALVLNSKDMTYDEIIAHMGKLAAEYVHGAIEKHKTLGITWGRSVGQTIDALKGDTALELKVVQVLGATVAENLTVDVPGLIRKVIKKYNGKGFYLNAPLYVEDDYVRNCLKEQPIIERTLHLAQKADMILTGIGDVSQDTMSYMWTGYNNRALLESLYQYNAVGFICAQAYDLDGHEIQNQFNKRIIGLKLHELATIPTVVGVSGGKHKTQAVLGALNGRYINVLVTDSGCAQSIINMVNF